jgi:hypothetical protein
VRIVPPLPRNTIPRDGPFGHNSGKNKALLAVAHSILTVLDHVLRERRPYQDLGADYVDCLDAARLERHHMRRLEQPGYKVDLTPLTA